MRQALDPATLLQATALLEKLARAVESAGLPIDTDAIRAATQELSKAYTFVRWQEDNCSWLHLVN